MSKYTWVVTRDSVLGHSSDAVGIAGPRDTQHRERFDTVIILGDHFRLLSGRGEPQFFGYIYGLYQGDEPLKEYGVENGCVTIEYELAGEWEPLNRFQQTRIDDPSGHG